MPRTHNCDPRLLHHARSAHSSSASYQNHNRNRRLRKPESPRTDRAYGHSSDTRHHAARRPPASTRLGLSRLGRAMELHDHLVAAVRGREVERPHAVRCGHGVCAGRPDVRLQGAVRGWSGAGAGERRREFCAQGYASAFGLATGIDGGGCGYYRGVVCLSHLPWSKGHTTQVVTRPQRCQAMGHATPMAGLRVLAREQDMAIVSSPGDRAIGR